MVYKRNGTKPYSRNGKTREDTKMNPVVKTKEFAPGMIKEAADLMLSDVAWMTELTKHDKFSIEWALVVLEELLYQSIGKKPVLITNMFGIHVPSYVFKEKGAIDIIRLIGQLTENFTETINLNIAGKIEKKETKTLELKTSDEITSDVLHILLGSGALKSGTKRLTEAEVVEVHSA